MWTRYELKMRAKECVRTRYWPLVLSSLIFAIATFSAGQNGIRLNVSDYGANLQLGPWTLWSSVSATYEVLMHILSVLAVGGTALTLLGIFLMAPLQVGCRRYFLTSMDEEAPFDCILQNFREGYLNTVLTMFLQGLFVVLWSLLLIIPGIMKAYSYRMVPYLLAEYPEMPWRDALHNSEELMRGERWNAFVLDLSFLGWAILSAISFGLVGLFYVNPYVNMTNTFLYRTLCQKFQNNYQTEPMY